MLAELPRLQNENRFLLFEQSVPPFCLPMFWQQFVPIISRFNMFFLLLLVKVERCRGHCPGVGWRCQLMKLAATACKIHSGNVGVCDGGRGMSAERVIFRNGLVGVEDSAVDWKRTRCPFLRQLSQIIAMLWRFAFSVLVCGQWTVEFIFSIVDVDNLAVDAILRSCVEQAAGILMACRDERGAIQSDLWFHCRFSKEVWDQVHQGTHGVTCFLEQNCANGGQQRSCKGRRTKRRRKKNRHRRAERIKRKRMRYFQLVGIRREAVRVHCFYEIELAFLFTSCCCLQCFQLCCGCVHPTQCILRQFCSSSLTMAAPAAH